MNLQTKLMLYTLLASMLSVVILLPTSVQYKDNQAEAHPGRTDADGGHVCRTNCESWGEVYGQWHYHGGGAVTPEEEYVPEPDPEDYEPDPEDSYTPSPAPVTPSTTSSSTDDSSKNDNCYIATASYGSPNVDDVVFLRDYRDKVLNKNPYGQIFIANYYRYSPYIANIIRENEILKFYVREIQIKPLVEILKLSIRN